MKNKTTINSTHLRAEEIISLIPDTLLDQFSLETGVDTYVKKFQGKIVFKLFIYAMLTSKTISLRILETIFASDKFHRLFSVPKKKLTHAGIAHRLKTMDARYVERIFSHLIASPEVESIFFADKRINARKIDSTIVMLSSKLLRIGLEKNQGRHAVKFGVELNQGIPVHIMLCDKQRQCSEDEVLPDLIRREARKHTINIAIFDRGIQRRQTFVDLSKQSVFFISRLTSQKVRVLEDHPIPQGMNETETLTVMSDQEVVFSNSLKTFKEPLRLVRGTRKQTGEVVSFLTNVTFLSAAEITELYRSRWEIETFFKFIKQELNFSHLLSRSENGIRVVMYLTMIVAILLTIYKRVNHIVGWASTKIQFLDELERDILLSWYETVTPLFYSMRQEIAQLRGG